jgi:diketogulonate reductase-like aldo/keto reductase
MTAYSPLGSADSADIFNHQGARLLEHPDVVAIAERLGRTPAQVLLRWAIERGTCAIAKSVHPERLRENLDVLSWALGDEQHATLSHLEPQKRLIHGALFLAEQGQYQTLAQLWDDDEETPDAQAAPTPKAPREDAGEDGVSVGA